MYDISACLFWKVGLYRYRSSNKLIEICPRKLNMGHIVRFLHLVAAIWHLTIYYGEPPEPAPHIRKWDLWCGVVDKLYPGFGPHNVCRVEHPKLSLEMVAVVIEKLLPQLQDQDDCVNDVKDWKEANGEEKDQFRSIAKFSTLICLAF